MAETSIPLQSQDPVVQRPGAKVVVLGGYGNFGARICRALVADPAIDVVIAGRDLGKRKIANFTCINDNAPRFTSPAGFCGSRRFLVCH